LSIRSVIFIFGAVKDILLQISAACFFVVLFQWRLGQSYMTRRDGRIPDDQTFLILGCAFSVLLCSVFSTTLFGAYYLNLGVLPAYIGILYGSYRSGVGIAALYFLCSITFSHSSGINNLVVNSGMLIYPLLFGMSASFKKGTVLEKIGLLWMALFPSLLFIALVPIMGGKASLDPNYSKIMIMTIFFTTALGAVLIYFIETIWDKLQIKQQIEKISKRFQWESDKLQQITNVVPLYIISLNEDGVVAGLNDLMVELFHRNDPNLTKGDILGQSVYQFLGKLDHEVAKQVTNSIRYKQRRLIKMVCAARSYHIYTAPLLHRSSGLPGGMVFVVQDMTEEDKMRSELDNVERLSLVGQMAAGITHEIRNPMAVVRGFLQLMREKSPDHLHSYYQIVMEELDRANSIINDFLSLAQSRSSSKEMVLLDDIIEDLSPLLWADANLRGQSVEMKLSPSLPRLQLNVREIKQLILNLGRNGMEAMGTKGVLTLETRSTPETVELIIRDTGCGISEGQIDKLFVPFFTTKSQGTGLGLSLCLNIVERHYGKIAVNSKEGIGTEFTISFPVSMDESLEIAE